MLIATNFYPYANPEDKRTFGASQSCGFLSVLQTGIPISILLKVKGRKDGIMDGRRTTWIPGRGALPDPKHANEKSHYESFVIH